ncbi:MAG: carbohydrate kinase [Oscillospiraceae bacterium]|nr:carbohydrate kinase [Oscillospiraceae bacterium]
MYDVAAIGELIIDFAPVCADEAGYPTVAAKAGGACGIFLAALAKYGAVTYTYAKVGDDAFGKLLINSLKNSGVEVSGIIKDPDVFTTLSFVTLDNTGNRSFSFSRKPGADTCLRFDELDLSHIRNAKYLHFGSLPMTNEPCRTAVKKAVEYAALNDTNILFDPNYRPVLWDSEDAAREQILWGLRQADVIKISDEEVEFTYRIDISSDTQIGVKKILDETDAKLVMLTCGPKGAYLATRSEAVRELPPPVKAIDTTGAGDIFFGSAMSRILKLGKAPEELNRKDLAEITRFAVTAAALSTQTHGGLPSVPGELEVLKMIC